MNSYINKSKELLEFIKKSPSIYHVIENIQCSLEENGYMHIEESDIWNLTAGGKYYVIRNGSSVIAFCIPNDSHICSEAGFHIVAAHSDSPTFKIKEKPEIVVEDKYVKLNTEKYGGMIMSTWLDRPLSVAGRLAYEVDGEIRIKTVNVDKDLLVIPNVAIHLNRDMNKGVEYNAQTDMAPLFAGVSKDESQDAFLNVIATAARIEKEAILGYDLFLYVRDEGRLLGKDSEFILSPKLDDIQSVFAALEAFKVCEPKENINIFAVFDNEEVGSATMQGADSTFLEDVLLRISNCLDESGKVYNQRIARSFLISADNAHAVHPNHPEKADPTNRPYINGGIVIKYHGSQKYTTDAVSAAKMKSLCKKANVPYQTYANKSDIAGGSTLGNISTAHVSVSSVDIGLPQLAMHSAVETAGSRDTEYAIEVLKVFWGE